MSFGGTFQENFESSWPNNWTVRDLHLYSVQQGPFPAQVYDGYGEYSSNTTKFLKMPISGAAKYHTAGTAHGINFGEITALKLIAKLSISGYGAYGMVWLSDSNQNGYGFTYRHENYQRVAAVKFSGSTTSFGGQPGWGYWEGEDWANNFTVGKQCTDFITFHIILRQQAPGQPVEMTLWQTDSFYYDTNESYPLQVKIDDGTGTIFRPGIINIKDLTHVGFTNYAYDGKTVRLDDIIVTTDGIPSEPNGVITVNCAQPVSKSGKNDMDVIREAFSTFEPTADSLKWIEPLGYDTWRLMNVRQGSSGQPGCRLVNGTFVASDRLDNHLAICKKNNIRPHIFVGYAPPDHLPSNAGTWTSADWNSYRAYCYGYVDYVLNKFDLYYGDNNNELGFPAADFEVENEQDAVTTAWYIEGTHEQGSSEVFYALLEIYKCWANAIDQFEMNNPGKRVRVGGNGSAGYTHNPANGDFNWTNQLAIECGQQNLRLNFVSWHSYEGIYLGRNHPISFIVSMNYLMALLRNTLNAQGLTNTEIWITEWGGSAYSEYKNSDEIGAAQAAAFLADFVNSGGSDGVYLLAEDILGSEWVTQAPLSYASQYPKAPYNVLKMFTMMPGSRVMCDSSDATPNLRGAIGSTDGNSIGVIAFNYAHSGTDRVDESNTESVQLKINYLPFNTNQAMVRRYLVDANHSNVYTMFIEKSLQPLFEQTLLTKTEEYTISVSDSSLTLPVCSMAPSAVSLWIITPDDTNAPEPDIAWEVEPFATGDTSIAMTASPLTDDFYDVEYYFTCTSGGGHNSGWQSDRFYEDTNLSPDTQYTYTVQARDTSLNHNLTTASTSKSAATSNLKVSLWPNPSEWKIEPYLITSTLYPDIAGGHDGSSSGSPVFVQNGRINGAVQFNSTTDYIQMTGYKGITGKNYRSCTAWIKTGSAGPILSWGNASTGQNWTFLVQDTHGVYLGGIAVEVGSGWVAGNTDIRDNQWHHVAAVLMDNLTPYTTEINLYVDGVLEAKTMYPVAINTASGTDVLMTAFNASRFNGTLDDVRIYDRILTGSEILSMASLSTAPTNGLVTHWTLDTAETTYSDTIVMEAKPSSLPMFLEDFETFANGTFGNLGFGSYTNEWVGRSWNTHKIINANGSSVLDLCTTSSNINWHIGGRKHNIRPHARSIELSFKMANSGNGAEGYVCLTNGDFNGYGIYVQRSTDLYAAVIKYSGNISSFDKIANWNDSYGENRSNKVQVGNTSEGFASFHLKIEQPVKGGPITLTLWHTDSDRLDSSYSSPDQVKIDNGSGAIFNTGLFNIEKLEYVALTATDGGNYVRVDDIAVIDCDAWASAEDVEYYFDSLTPDGQDSGWQNDFSYTDSGLPVAALCTYKVKMRDPATLQETIASNPKSAFIPCRMDFDGNNKVDFYDLEIMILDWLSQGSEKTDFIDDDIVNSLELSEFAKYWMWDATTLP